MPLSIPVIPARQKMIREHIKKQEEDVGGQDRLPRQKLIVKGQAQHFPIYRFALDILSYNKGNGRIKAEVIEKEAELGRELTPSDEQGQKIIKEILLSITKSENEKIKEDLRKIKQINPGIITCDGIVINGNRRKALLEELYNETGNDEYNYLDVHVLPSDINKAELWLIEAGIQLSAPQQLDYSPINHLLKLREGRTAGLQIEKMAARIYGVSKDKIDADLKRLELIDEYLQDYLSKDGKYYLVRGLNEHFINLQNILDWAEHPRGPVRRNWNPDESDMEELKLVGFYYIRMRMPHLRVRDIRDLFARHESWSEVKNALAVPVELTSEQKSRLGIDPEYDLEEDEEEELQEQDEKETFTTKIEERDLREDAIWRDVHKGQLKSFFQDAKEQVQIIKDSERPLTLARRALKNIEAIPEDPEKLQEPDMDEVLSKIIARTNALRKLTPRRKSRMKKRKKMV
jgi:hypothetical protein